VEAAESAAADAPNGVLEVRVHGVNRQNDYSSLGRGERLAAPRSSPTDTFVVPRLPERSTLWLFNWSRANRGLTGPLWYAALPFTFLNVAAETGWGRPGAGGADDSPGRRSSFRERDRTVIAVVAVQGVLLSCTALLWLIAIIETIVGHSSFDRYDPERMADLAVGAAVLILVATVLFRQLGVRGRRAHRGRGSFAPMWLSALHVTAILALAAWLRFARPGQALDGESVFGRFLSGHGPIAYWSEQSPCAGFDLQECFRGEAYWEILAEHPDVLSIALVIGILASILLAGVLLIRSAILACSSSARATRAPASAVGASILVAGSWLLLAAYGSALRMGIEWIYLALEPFLYRNPSLHPLAPKPHLVVSSYDLNLWSFSMANLMPAVAVGALLLFVLAFVILSAGRGPSEERSAARPSEKTPVWRLFRYLHVMISRLPDRLGLVTVVTAVLWLASIAVLWVVDRTLDDVEFEIVEEVPQIVDASTWDNRVAAGMLAVSLILGIFAIVFALFFGRIRVVREFLDSVADVLGFFPIRWHPLAGLSYREIVLPELEQTLARWQGPIVYSGHSQGSVIGFWLLRHVNSFGGRVRFVTSGSPLQTLYSTFFPRYFNEEEAGAVLARTHTWINVWRLTDPIGSPLWPDTRAAGAEKPEKRIDNADAVDPIGEGMPVRWHLDYWTDPVLNQKLRGLDEG
jgi:hypothetical protein